MIRRAIGEPKQRYPDADIMAAALQFSGLPFSRLRSLRGKAIVFTGPMAIHRKHAQELAVRAGAIVKPDISGQVDVVVVGGRSPNWIAGSKGVKLLEARALQDRGVGIRLITEQQFGRLVQQT